MRLLTAQESQVFANVSGYQVRCRVLIKDSVGAFQDYSTLLGYDWILSVEWDEDVDQPVAAATVTLIREYAKGLSLAPLRTDSMLYGYVDIAREIKIETACLPTGVDPVAGDWLLAFHGYVDTVDFASSVISLSCVDLGSKLQITFIEEQRDYSNDTGVSVQSVMQQILDDNGLSSITLYTPTSPGWNIRKFRQEKMSVMDALTALAYQIGWDVRYKYDNGTSTYRLTFASPDRTKVAVDYTLSPDIYLDVMQLSISRRDIRNAVRVSFYDRATLDPAGEPTFTRTSAIDATSITKYGRQWMEITEGASSQIDTLVEANKMRDAALADLKDPVALQDVELHLFPNIEIGDLLRFTANGVHYTANQDLAVTKVRHSVAEGRTRTVVSVRGKPSGPRNQWFQMETRPGVAPAVRSVGPQAPTNVTVTSLPGGATVKFTPPLVGAWDMFELHVSSSSGFTPSAATFVAQGTLDRFNVENLTPGATYYAKIVPRDPAGNRGTASAEVTLSPGYVTTALTEPIVSFGNIPPNADFEANNMAGMPPDKWSMLSGTWGVSATLSTDAYTGNKSVRMIGGCELVSEWFTVVADERYYVQGFEKPDAAGYPSNVWVDWADSSFSVLSSSSGSVLRAGGTGMPAGGAWHKFESGMNCPASARYGRVRIQNLMDTRIDSVYVMRGARGGIWGILPLLNSWANVGGAWPAFNALKDLNSRVYLRGALTGGTLGAVVVQMPTWARPKYDFEVPVYAWDGAAIAHVICNVRANGDVILWGDTNYHVDLAAVNWVAE